MNIGVGRGCPGKKKKDLQKLMALKKKIDEANRELAETKQMQKELEEEPVDDKL